MNDWFRGVRLDALALTKLDILTGLERLKVCVGYRVAGQEVAEYPADAEMLSGCESIYEELPAWSEEISSAREFDDLPEAARQYVRFVEETAGVPVKWVGVGPEREEVVPVS